MSDRDALLAAVLAAPEDNLPRLVFADWLEETGHPGHAARARFIRLQIAAEATSDRAELDRQAAEILSLYGAGWQAELPDWVAWRDTEIEYRRGFVEKVVATPRRLFRDGQELFAVAPVQDVRLRAQRYYSGRSQGQAFPDLPFFERIRTLTLGPRLWVPEFLDPDHRVPTAHFLLTAQRLSGLRCLIVADGGVTDEWVVRFATGFTRAAFARSLTHLDLSKNVISDAAAHTLATARGLDRLQQIRLTGNRLSPEGVDVLRRRFGDRVVV